MHLVYSLFIYLLEWGMKCASFFNFKIKKGIDGRKKSFDVIKSQLKFNKKCIWMHAASLGEYEQGLPVLEKLKKEFPKDQILISFFSASGYEHVIKQAHLADAIIYLPFDTRYNAEKLTNTLNLRLFFTVKYDFWYQLFNELNRKNVPIFVISCLFYPNQIYFKNYGRWMVQQLKKTVTAFFHQTQNSQKLAHSVGLNQGECSGDTRFDRVKQLVEHNTEIPFIKKFIDNKDCLIFGSAWEAEEEIAMKLLYSDWNGKIIIAPHDLKRVEFFYEKTKNEACLYSHLDLVFEDLFRQKILIIDSIGLLSRLYQYASIAVVGGGFHKKGLHNILEALAYGKPVVFGNKYLKNPEADEAISQNCGFSFENSSQAYDFILTSLGRSQKINLYSQNAQQWMRAKTNASQIIVEGIKQRLQS